MTSMSFVQGFSFADLDMDSHRYFVNRYFTRVPPALKAYCMIGKKKTLVWQRLLVLRYDKQKSQTRVSHIIFFFSLSSLSQIVKNPESGLSMLKSQRFIC